MPIYQLIVSPFCLFRLVFLLIVQLLRLLVSLFFAKLLKLLRPPLIVFALVKLCYFLECVRLLIATTVMSIASKAFVLVHSIVIVIMVNAYVTIISLVGLGAEVMT